MVPSIFALPVTPFNTSTGKMISTERLTSGTISTILMVEAGLVAGIAALRIDMLSGLLPFLRDPGVRPGQRMNAAEPGIPQGPCLSPRNLLYCAQELYPDSSRTYQHRRMLH